MYGHYLVTAPSAVCLQMRVVGVPSQYLNVSSSFLGMGGHLCYGLILDTAILSSPHCWPPISISSHGCCHRRLEFPANAHTAPYSDLYGSGGTVRHHRMKDDSNHKGQC